MDYLYMDSESFLDVESFLEDTSIKPLLKGHIVITPGKKMYRVERPMFEFDKYSFTKHCYVFIDVTMGADIRKKPLAQKPSAVIHMIKNKKLIITNTIYPK